MDEWEDKWMHGCTKNGWCMHERPDAWIMNSEPMNGWTNAWLNGWMNEWMDEFTTETMNTKMHRCEWTRESYEGR